MRATCPNCWQLTAVLAQVSRSRSILYNRQNLFRHPALVSHTYCGYLRTANDTSDIIHLFWYIFLETTSIHSPLTDYPLLNIAPRSPGLVDSSLLLVGHDHADTLTAPSSPSS